MRHLLLVGLLMFVQTLCVAQLDHYLRISPGGWTDNTVTWSLTRGGAPCECVPGPNDNVFLEGNQVFIFGADVEINNVNLLFNVADQIVLFGETRTLTVNGQIRSYELSPAPFPPFPTTAVDRVPSAALITQDLNFTINFTNNGNVVTSWNTLAPLPNVIFTSSGTANINSSIAITSGGTFNINSGNVNVESGLNISQTGSATLNQLSGTLFTINGSINGDGNNTSRFGTVNLNGTASTGGAGYINAENFSLGSGATLNIGFNGTDQTQGWWFQSTSPTSTSIDESSTITYNANADQTVAATSYGSLSLLSSVNPSNKTLQSTNNLVIRGDLTINSANVTFVTTSNTNSIELDGDLINNGTWSPDRLVSFSSISSSQNITGDNPVSFDGGIRIENTAGTVSLFNQDIDINGLLDIDPSATFNPDVNNVTISGNFQNDGTLSVGSVGSTFTFDGSSAITGTGTTSFNNVLITNVLTSSSGTINVAGNFTNNGTFNRNAGTVNFNGSGSIAGTVGFENMNIDGTVTNTGTVQLYGTFTPVTGSFNTGNDFTVMSTSLSGDGRIAAVPLSGFAFTGNLTAQRFVDGVFDGDWRYISSPVVGATLNNWQNSGMPITGDFSDASPAGVNNVVSSAVPSVYARNSAAGTWDAVTAAGGATSTVTLVNGTGYSAYTYVNGNLTLEVTGTLRSGNVSIPLTGATTAADPFYLIGNPYPSPIDWDLVRDAANTDLGVTMYLRTSLDNYASYNAELNLSGGVNPPPSWGGEILMGQSFWVNSNNTATSVSITEGMKSAVGNGQFLREAEGSHEVISIKLSNETQNDKTVVFLKAGATDAFDYEYDGKKQLNGNFNGATGRRSWMNLSSYNALDSGQLFVFNGVDNDFCNKEVGLVVNDLAEGSYVLEFDKYTLAGYSVKLVDAYADSEITISEGATYAFDVSPDTTSYGNRRFKLVMEATAIERDLDFNTSVNNDCDVDYVEVVLDDVQEGVEYVLKGPDGNNLSNPAVAPGSQVVLFINKLNLEDAVNSISVLASTPSSCIGDVIYTNSITYDYNPKPGISVVSAGAKCKGDEQPLTLSVSGAPANGYYRWYDSPESLEPIAGEDQDELVLNNIKSTRSYYASAVNSEGCESERVKVMAEVLEIETPALVVEGQVLIAPAAESYQWYLDDEPIAGADEQELTVSSTGEYKVEVFNAGCSSFSEAMAFSITSIDDELYDLGLSVYPNPTVNRLNFNFFKGGGQADQLQLVLYDIEGKIVKTEEDVIHSNSKGDSYMSVGDLEKGLFILNIKLNNKIISLQIIKME